MIDERVKLERAELRAALKKAQVRATYDHEVDLCDLAEAAAVSDSLPSRWASQRCPDTIGFVDVILAGRRFPVFAHRMLAWAAEQIGLVVAKRIDAPAVHDHLAHLATLARESGELVSEYAAGSADGRWTDEDLARLHRALRGLEEAAAGLRAWLDGERAARAVPSLRSKGRAA